MGLRYNSKTYLVSYRFEDSLPLDQYYIWSETVVSFNKNEDYMEFVSEEKLPGFLKELREFNAKYEVVCE